MRTLRLSVVAVVTLILMGGVAAAQTTEVPETPTWLSGQVSGVDQVSAGQQVSEEGRTRSVGETFVGEQTADDPRLSGTLTAVNTFDHWATLGGSWVSVGLLTLENEAGSWQGDQTSLRGPGAYNMQAELVGAGEYEGLRALLYYADVSGAYVLQGIIFEGEMPPMPEPSAEQ